MIPKDINTIDPVARPADILIGYQSSGEVGARLVTYFATSVQGGKADTALQPTDIGVTVQAFDAGLQSIAGLTTAANTMIYTTALDVYTTTALTPFSRTLLDDGSAAAWKTTLGLAAVASSGSATDLTTGTLPDAQLPARLNGTTVVLDSDPNGWNSATLPGYYTGRNGTANAPAVGTFMGHVIKHNTSGFLRQELWEAQNPPLGWVRYQVNNVWGSWRVALFDQTTLDARYALASRTITAGSGLTGGGDLSANRTLAVNIGTTAGTVAAGNDPRFAAQVPTSRQVIAGTGLTGGGDLSADRTFNVTYGTTAGTAAQGNDSRITGAVPNTRTISAGTGLTGGGDLTANRSFAVSYGTTAGTAAQGNDSRIVNAITQAQVLTLFNASGSAPVYAVRAWVNFNGTGTVAIRGSGNVSSITDNGTGDYIVNFTTALPNVNYAVALGSSNLSYYVQAGKTVSAVNVGNVQTTGASVDPDTYSVVILA